MSLAGATGEGPKGVDSTARSEDALAAGFMDTPATPVGVDFDKELPPDEAEAPVV